MHQLAKHVSASVGSMTLGMKVVEDSATSHHSQLADQIWAELDTKGDEWKREREGIEKSLGDKIAALEEVILAIIY